MESDSYTKARVVSLNSENDLDLNLNFCFVNIEKKTPELKTAVIYIFIL